MKVEFWVGLINPLDDQKGEDLGPFGELKLSCEDLRTADNKVIAQLHDDNYWRIHKDYNKSDVDGWMELEILLKE